ncbi:MAG: hypothetical protein HFH12_00620 [Dorea sp.]|nr:hypothetical protein [Dorea sp.]
MIDGAVYTIGVHFNAESTENVKEKAERIFQKP